jgi:hypothetical protein
MRQSFSSLPGRWSGILFCVLLLAAAPAFAAVRWVSPSGNDASSGDSPATAWKTISKANAALLPGDVCMILPGSYANSINPAKNGAAGTRITFVGDLANPGAVTIPSFSSDRSYVTVKGVALTNDPLLKFPARFDSIAYCRLSGLELWAAKNCMIARNTIVGNINIMANDGRACFTGTTFDPGCTANSEYDTLRDNTINLGTIQPGQKKFVTRGFTQRCLFERNQVTGVFDKAGSTLSEETFGLIMYNSYYNTFRDNRWTFEALSSAPPNNQWEAFRLRDSTRNNVFERDTMLLGLNSSFPVRGLFAASGSFVHSAGFNRWSQCYYKTNSYFYNQDAFMGNVIENSVFASKTENALWFQGTFENSTIRHNLVHSGGQAMRVTKVVGTSNEFTSNIYYSGSAQGSSAGDKSAQAYFESNAKTGFRSNYNLFFTPSNSGSPGDRSIGWCCVTLSRPGAGQPWNSMNGQDANSRYGSPLLADSSFTGLDATLRPGSLAIGRGENGSDAGPIPFSSGGPDVTPPTAVNNLGLSRVYDSSALILWTAPGDDASVGIATQYDIRVSRDPITATNFAAATPILELPTPLAAGSTQEHLVTGLASGTAWYVALKARDEAGNWSPVSNTVSLTTTLVDLAPPRQVTDLKVRP